MRSRRLPGKVVAELGGFPQVEFLIRRIKRAKLRGKILLATTYHSVDDPVARIGERVKIPVVRGPEDDVLSRFRMALEQYPADIVVRVTGDNPLTAPEIFDIVIKTLIRDDLDYVHVPNAPYGGGVDAFTATTLKLCSESTILDFDREHINGYILNNMDAFNVAAAPLPEKWNRPDVRITVDTLEDQAVVRRIIAGLGNEPIEASMDQIIREYDQIMQ